MWEKSDEITYLLRSEIVLMEDEQGNPLNAPIRVRDTTDLQAAIRAAGDRLLQPLVVFADGGKPHLIAGHRRLVATKALGLYLDSIPCVIIDVDRKAAELAMVAANRQRALTLRECVRWAIRLKSQGYGDTKISEAMGKGATTVWRLRKLNEAHPSVQEAVYSGRLPFRSFELMATKTQAEQKEILDKAKSRARNDDGRVSHKALKKAKAEVRAKREPGLPLITTLYGKEIDETLNAVDQLKLLSASLALITFDVKPHDRLRFLFVLGEMKEHLDTLRKEVERDSIKW